ncbi:MULTISPECIES: class I SAM-dependent methyltransferase [Halomicrobium]|uniref:Methyltransferase type 11 n=2 Tax=Halomicrobium mukohataei TaxID=57705 RepID=C7NWA1_HALMD|nr:MULTISPECIES: class I SAM-dependent methyltransferase [Halomicrobium]ACV46242.1 Methyltransferase type 11 [Halomicrobium mukohataei DSM 12286]QCD64803.1 class I SAM-dependent methyltransferase [Halomicrobium mukohataei]QFR19610.1 methyltransferase domain-containing protein [Halomicrobium sp. ZPS1]
MAVPSTVTTALADRPVEGRRCLEAGAGVGNATAGLLDAGAERVYAVTNDRAHARTTRERVADGDTRSDRLAVLESDLRTLALADDSIELITAHGLCNVLDPAELSAVAATFRRVAAPGCHLVIDDYAPLPETAAVRELFAVENAAAELATGGPALTFYPPDALRRCFVGGGWSFDRERTLLDPVPWTADHLSAHAVAARDHAAGCPGDLGDRLAARADRLATAIGSESAGRMYSLAFRLSA